VGRGVPSPVNEGYRKGAVPLPFIFYFWFKLGHSNATWHGY